MTTTYQCPMCGKTMERDLTVFLNHTEKHVIDRIKEEHPSWVEADGVCKPCAAYYRSQITGEAGPVNIGPRGRARRRILGLLMLTLSFGLLLGLMSSGSAAAWRLVLFAPFFLAMLCLLQSREKTCIFLAERGLRDLDSGEGKIRDEALARTLRARGRMILIKSAFLALLLTALSFLLS